MAAYLHRDRARTRSVRRRHFVEWALAVGIKMRDRAGAYISNERNPTHGMARTAAADQTRRFDAEVFRRNRDFLGPQAPSAVQEIGDGGRRAPERLGQAAARLACLLEPFANPIDSHALSIRLFRIDAIKKFRNLLNKCRSFSEYENKQR